MSASPTAREDLRRRWLEHTRAVFERFFPDDASAPLPSFDQLEGRAASLAHDLASWLLEERLGQAAQAPDEPAACCPRCGRPARRLEPPDGRLPKRTLTTRVGDIELARPKWRCTTCRVVFFPPR
jgi:hypothetical protein